MSYLLFMDESGHDHKQTPYKVRGGIALRAERVWKFALVMRDAELDEMGVHLHECGSELKGEKLFNKDRFKWAGQINNQTGQPYAFEENERQELAKRFLVRGVESAARHKRGEEPLRPTRREMSAYGQACLRLADRTLDLLDRFNASLFISTIPCNAPKRQPGEVAGYLRKDLVYLFERYYYLLERESETGLLVLDQIEKTNDRRYGSLLANYFSKTQKGRQRSERLVPVPLFVTQDLSYALQAADLCLYAMNWGCRFHKDMTEPAREEVRDRYEEKLMRLRFKTRLESGELSFSFVHVPNPFGSGEQKIGDNAQGP